MVIKDSWQFWYLAFFISVLFLVAGYFMSVYAWIWGAGREKAFFLFSFLIVIPWLVMASKKRLKAAGNRFFTAILVCLVAGAVVWHVSVFSQFMRAPQVNDIGGRALQAIGLLLEGQNPYEAQIDPKPELAGRFFEYQGLVYMPVTVLAYLPLGARWGAQGLLATNLLLDLVMVFLVYMVGWRLASPAAGLLSVFLYLAIVIVPYELFRTGSTDIVAVLPLMGALLLYGRRNGWTGFLVGLSVAAKLFPGLLFLPILFSRRGWRRYVLGVLVGLIPFYVFLLWSPKAVLGSAVMFSFVRRADPTGWLQELPLAAGMSARLVFLWLFINAVVLTWLRRPDVIVRLGMVVALVLGSLLSGPAIHGNYQMWWVPFYAVLVSMAVLGSQAARGVKCGLT